VVAAITFGALKGVTANDGYTSDGRTAAPTLRTMRDSADLHLRGEEGDLRRLRGVDSAAGNDGGSGPGGGSAGLSSAGPLGVTPTAPPPSEPAPEITPQPALEPVEAAICAYPWECSIALRVARCESGPDYEAGFNASGHGGTFQISPIHAWRFAARGLDFWIHAVVLEWNLEVAYEIYTERWWHAWTCF
jgi:hypothetical protein